MVKKSIIAIAVMCMLATVTFAQGDAYDGALKIPEGQHWPCICEYEELTLCQIPVFLKVGMFVKVDCSGKIVLHQVDCTSIGKAIDDFPCYKGCKDNKLAIKSNFEVKLKAKFEKSSDIIPNNNKTSCYFDDGVNPVSSSYTFIGSKTVDLCVEAWQVNVYNGTPGDEAPIGTVTITALPTGTPECAG